MRISIIIPILLSLGALPGKAQESPPWQNEKEAALEAADEALENLHRLFSNLQEDDFSNEPTSRSETIGRIEIPAGTPRVTLLRQRIQFLIAQIDLAQDYPAASYKAQTTIENLVKGKDYFGVRPSRDYEAFAAKQKLIDRLFADEELQLGNRLFGLLQTSKDTPKDSLNRWIKHVEKMASPYYFGADFDRHAMTLGRSLNAMSLLYGVISCEEFKSTLAVYPDLKFSFEQAMAEQLKPAVIKFARDRYEKGGMLRDWCLPVVATAHNVFPDLTRESVGVTPLTDYQKSSLSHARAVTQLAARIDDTTAAPKEANRALKTITSYREKPYYIGSNEIRENGTLKIGRDLEVETLLANADFFGPDGNRNMKTYRKRTEHLDNLFLGEESGDNLELLIGLKSETDWMDFFEKELFGSAQNPGVFSLINQSHEVSIDHLKLLFLARLILPNDVFITALESDPVAFDRYEKLLLRFGDHIRDTSSLQFRNYSESWLNVQNAFLEVAKGFPEYQFEHLKVTTSADLKMVRRDFEAALYGRKSVANDFTSLLMPDSTDLIPSIDHMTSPHLSKRTGKFDKQLSPEFVNRVNEKLNHILEYRSYGLAAIDTLERPDLQVGRIMTHLAVSDYRIPDDTKTNTVLHDLLCGPEGGFGGLGQIFRPDAKGYRERESVLDAIATTRELELGEVLFKMALDLKRDNQSTDLDLSRAAARWIKYFRKSQANAQFHTVPDVVNQAVRGTFLSRLVFQSESFRKALENSRNASVGSSLDISHEFEEAVSAQVRKMQSMLATIDPETASNRNIEENSQKWQDLKVWYLDSTKWLETVIEDPLLIGEVTRVRKLQRKIADYQKLCPEVVVFQKELDHFGGEVYSQSEPPTIGLARFAMEKVCELEPDLSLPLPELEGTPEDEEKLKQLEFGKAVSNQFLAEIREAVREAGLPEIANLNNVENLDQVYNQLLASEARENSTNPTSVANRARAMEESFKAAIARAVSRVEAEQPSDFKTLDSQSVRAAKVDRVLTEKELEQYRIDLQPSIVLHDWINQDKVEIMASFRTVELSAEARQMIHKAKEQRRSMEQVEKELREIKAQSIHKVELLQDWIDKAEGGTNVEVVMEEVIAMRDEVSLLKKEVASLRDSESLMRARAADFAQQIFRLKQGIKAKAEDETPDPSQVIASAPQPEPEEETRRSTYSAPRPTARSSSSSSSRTRSSSSRSSGGSFFRRLFGRR